MSNQVFKLQLTRGTYEANVATVIRRKAAEMVKRLFNRVLLLIQIPSYHHPTVCTKAICNHVCGRLRKQNGGVRFRYIPVLVETATALLGQMLCPDIDQSTQTEWSLDVADGANNNHWWRLQDGHSLDDLLLVDLCVGKVIQIEVKHVFFFCLLKPKKFMILMQISPP